MVANPRSLLPYAKVLIKTLKVIKTILTEAIIRGESCDDLSTPATPEMSHSNPTSSACSVSRPHRSDYSKRSTRVDNVVMHYCDASGIPSDARKIDVRHWVLYKLDWSVTQHVFELLRLIDKEGAISNYYRADDENGPLHPFENVLSGYHVDIDMIAQILVDKLFCGSEQAAKNTSLIYSIIESCKMNGLRPVKYIADVLRKLVSGETDYMALLPMNIVK